MPIEKFDGRAGRFEGFFGPITEGVRADGGRAESVISPTVSFTLFDQSSDGFSIKTCWNWTRKPVLYLNLPIGAFLFKAGLGEAIDGGYCTSFTEVINRADRRD